MVETELKEVQVRRNSLFLFIQLPFADFIPPPGSFVFRFCFFSEHFLSVLFLWLKSFYKFAFVKHF